MVNPPGSPTNPLERKYLKQVLNKYLGKTFGKGLTNPLGRKCLGKMPKKLSAGEECHKKIWLMPDKSSGEDVLEKIGKSQTNSLGMKRLKELVKFCDRFPANMSKQE